MCNCRHRSAAPPHRRLTRLRLTVVVAIAVLAGAACGGDGVASPTREYVVRLRAEEQGEHYTYIAEDPVDLRAGDRVTFEMRNDGVLIHDLAVVDEAGTELAVADAVGAGQVLRLSVDFEEPGLYRLRCNVDDHLTVHDMQVFVEVKEPGDAG